jgi:ABC-2 type transport system permease protein
MSTEAGTVEMETTDESLTPPARISGALRTLRRHVIRNTLDVALRTSRLRIATILFCSMVFWWGLFLVFLDGFRFIEMYVDLLNTIIEHLFSMFFLSLLVMLFFSTGIITYTALFHSRESTYLLTTPASADQIFAHRFVEAVGFSSWGFFLLGSPLMLTYGLKVNAPFLAYGVFLLYLVSFVLLAGSLGAVAALVVANIFPRREKTVLASVVVFALVLVGLLIAQIVRAPGERLSSDWVGTVLGRLAFCQNSIWPSRWMSAGLLASARGDWNLAAYYFMFLSSHAALAYLIAAVVARDLYRRGYSRVQGGRSTRRRASHEVFDSIFHRLFFFLSRPVRLLILKDLRSFLRDPAQWSQFLIFFGLLSFYFLNIRRLSYDMQNPYWRNLVSFLNISVTALLLSTFTSRFIFPLLSLEGRNFWILGLLPLRREQILWGKFAFSAGISLVSTEALVLLSDLMLRMGPIMIILHLGMVAILCLGLSGISVGLGARLPNLRENDPSKIAAGFGGTLNLLVSLVFIFTVVTALALPCHLYYAGQDQNEATRWALSHEGFRFWLSVAIVASLIVGALGTLVPLRIGIRAFQRMEL